MVERFEFIMFGFNIKYKDYIVNVNLETKLSVILNLYDKKTDIIYNAVKDYLCQNHINHTIIDNPYRIFVGGEFECIVCYEIDIDEDTSFYNKLKNSCNYLILFEQFVPSTVGPEVNTKVYTITQDNQLIQTVKL